MSHETYLGAHFPEGKTARFTLTLKDDATGAPIPGALIDALTVTLFDADTGTFLPQTPATGARNHQNILGVNGGAVSAGGVVTLQLTAGDMARVDATLSVERHGAQFEWAYASAGTPKSGVHTVWFEVYDLAHSP